MFYKHPENEFIEPFANYKFDYQLTNYKHQNESRNIFFNDGNNEENNDSSGIKPLFKCLFIHHSKLKPIYDKLKSVLL
jgi:protein BCP1